MADKEASKKIKYFITAISGFLGAFLVFIVALKLNIPVMITIGEKILTLNNLHEAYNAGTLYLSTFIPYVVLSFIIITTIIISTYISKRNDNPLLLIAVLFGFLTQGVMVMAPYSPLRTTFTSIILFGIGIVYLVMEGEKNGFSVIIAFLIALVLQNIYLSMLLLLVYIGFKSLKLQSFRISNELLAIVVVLLIVAMGNVYQVYAGYKINKKISYDNITKIEAFLEENPTQEEQENMEIYLFLPKDERYGFTPMAGIDWVDEAIKGYFGINDSVQLVPEDSQFAY